MLIMLRRKVSYRLYPSQKQARVLERWRRLHCELYNAGLQERIEAWKKAHQSISYFDQQNQLPQIKQERPELVPLGAHALQHTLKRLDRAFAGFFRRVKAGQNPGFPRFKSSRRFAGFAYPDRCGWKLVLGKGRKHHLQIGSGVHAMTIRIRGMHRFGADAKPNDVTLSKHGDNWTASVTLRVAPEACARQRTANRDRGLDFGVNDWATFDDGSAIANPRHLRSQLVALAKIQRARARKKRGSLRYRRLSRALARTHERISNRRKDFVHKQTSALVAECRTLATEKLALANMSRSAKGTLEKPGARVRQKAGLNREILSVALGLAHGMLAYKAAEAGTHLHLVDTRKIKPSQRCARCWAIVKKNLADRVHRCGCGHEAQRDQNAAAVCLVDAFAPGTGAAARG